MALKELNESREVIESRDGKTGRRLFLYTGEWAGRKLEVPAIGDAFPDEPDIVCVERRFAPAGRTGDGTNQIGYSACRIECAYTSRDPSSIVYGNETMEASVDLLTIPAKTYWANDGTPVSDGFIAIHIPKICLSYEMNITSYDKLAVLNLMGCVNSEAWRGWSAGNVLFDGPSAKTEYTGGGTYHNVTFKFSIRAHAWNTYLRTDTMVWEARTTAVYPGGDFSLLPVPAS